MYRSFGQILRVPLSFIPAETEVRVCRGPLKGMKWIKGSSVNGCWLGTYERATTKHFQALIRPAWTVWDVGANVGYYTLMAARLVGSAGRVIAFEPLSRNRQYLIRHVESNGLSQVSVRGDAICDSVGTAFFEGAGSEAHLGNSGEQVPTTTLDTVLAEQSHPPQFIKIDTEGAEFQVLQGAEQLFSAVRPILLLATHSDELERRCLAWLRDRGYTNSSVDGAFRDFLCRPS